MSLLFLAFVAALLTAAPASHASLTFTRADYAVGLGPSAVVAGSLNSIDPDPFPFVAVANRGADTVSVLRSDGSGGLVSAGPAIAVGDEPVAIAAADFTGDQKIDLAVANRGVGDTVTILSGDGGGGFSTTTTLIGADGIGTDPSGLYAADIDGDGDNDLVVANAGSDSVTVLLNNGAGVLTKTAASPITVGDEPVAVTGDCCSLFVVNRSSGNLSIVSAPAGTGVVTPFSTGIGSLPVAIDARCDELPGCEDIYFAVVNSGSNSTSLLHVQPSFGPLPGSPLAVGATPAGVAAGPFAGNFKHVDALSWPAGYNSGFSDFAVANGAANSVSFLISDGDQTFRVGTGTLTTGSQPVAIAQGDLDGNTVDGDLVTANVSANTISVLLNTRTPAAAIAPPSLAYTSQPRFTLADAQAVTVTNTGGAPLVVSGVRLVGANPGDFVVSSDGCRGYRIPAGYDATCRTDVRFAPTATGTRTATLRTTDEHGVVRDVALSGTGGDLPAGPAGATGATGAGGATGATGPQGPPGKTVVRLYSSLAVSSLSARKGKRFRVRYVITRGASVNLDVMKGTRRVLRVRRTVATGGRKSGYLTVKRVGRYTLRLTARSSDGQTTTDRIRLNVR